VGGAGAELAFVGDVDFDHEEDYFLGARGWPK